MASSEAAATSHVHGLPTVQAARCNAAELIPLRGNTVPLRSQIMAFLRAGFGARHRDVVKRGFGELLVVNTQTC